MWIEYALFRFSLIHGFRTRFLNLFAQHLLATLCASRPIFFWQQGIVNICFRDLHAPWSDPLSLFNFCQDKNESRCFVVEHLFVLIIICKYCDWRRTDVGPMSAGDIKPTSKRRWVDIAWANIDPRSAQRQPNTCSLEVFFHPKICQKELCAEIVPTLEATINSGPVLARLQTYCTLTWKVYPY